MPDKNSESYKTEEQLKQETKARRSAESADSADRTDSEFQKKGENFWYHYKWHTIIGLTIVALVAFFIKDLVFRPRPDATIVMVAERDFSPDDIDSISAAIGEATCDPESAGASVIIDYIRLPAETGPNTTMMGQDYAINMKLSTILATGVDPIYLLDEAAYSYLIEMGRQEGDPPGTDNIFVADSVSAEMIGEDFRGLRFYLRRSVGKTENYYEGCRILLQKIAGEG